jgi:putative sigma-54 modulation protein
MQLTITGRHIDITESLDTHIKEKMAKVKKHFDQVLNINVILEVVKNVQSAEAKLHISGTDLFAKVEDDDMYSAIDKMIKKLDTQIIKYKEKHGSHRG